MLNQSMINMLKKLYNFKKQTWWRSERLGEQCIFFWSFYQMLSLMNKKKITFLINWILWRESFSFLFSCSFSFFFSFLRKLVKNVKKYIRCVIKKPSRGGLNLYFNLYIFENIEFPPHRCTLEYFKTF